MSRKRQAAAVSGFSVVGITVFGGTVTFSFTTDAAEPWVSLVCDQAGQHVYGQYWDYAPGYAASLPAGLVDSTLAWDGVFTLGPTFLWSSGPASAVAQLYTVDPSTKAQTVLATTSFDVSG